MPTHRGSAQKLVEYGLIIALVALVAVIGLVLFGDMIASLFDR
jgi:Flp pilus assembly pilin Flp